MTRLDPVDAEAVVVTYLESRDDALLPSISTKMPRGWRKNDRHVRVSRIGGLPDWPYALDHARVQIDAFGTDEADAFAMAARASRYLDDLTESGWSFPGAIVTHVAPDLGITAAPDPLADGAPRYLFGRILTLHPTPV